MDQFYFRNNDSLPAHGCICRPTGDERHKEGGTTQMAQREVESRSSHAEGLPLSLGRQKNRDKEEQCREQHYGRTGRDIPVRRDEYSPD